MKLNEETGFYENYSFEHVPFWQTTWFFVVSVSIALAIFALICFLLIKYFLKKRAQKKLSPKQQLLKELATIEHMVRVDRAHNDAYFMLTSAVKNYLIQQYHLPLAQKTAIEIVAYSRTTQLTHAWITLISDIFSACEPIVFGGAAVQDELILSMVVRVKELVKSDMNEKAPD